MIKVFASTILLWLSLIYGFIIGDQIKPYYDYYIAEPKLMRRSYVVSITGDYLDVQLVKKHLDNFNTIGHNRILRFEKLRTNDRPITIEVRVLGKDFYENLNKDSLLGYTISLEDKCTIVLVNDMPLEQQFRDVIIHEILHCYSYEHTKDPNDLMYPYNNFNDYSLSIEKYAKELEKRMYE